MQANFNGANAKTLEVDEKVKELSKRLDGLEDRIGKKIEASIARIGR